MMDPLSRQILEFWFGTADMTVEVEKREVWFRSTPEFDRHLIENYADIHERAATGALDRLMHTAEDCLSLVIALDQFPRNIFRGTARAFATDPRARRIARHALENAFDRNFARWPRTFFYLPFTHSEDLADQKKAVSLYATLGDESAMRSAVEHHDAIARFGRFPHRNAVLGRANTPEEQAYLEKPPLWGKTAAEVAALETAKE